jgi:hypothetical protein
MPTLRRFSILRSNIHPETCRRVRSAAELILGLRLEHHLAGENRKRHYHKGEARGQ